MEQDLTQDLWNSPEFLTKIRTRKDYAQNVYAAMCNMRWQPAEVWPVLKDDYWSCSWRAAGGIVAEFRAAVAREDYMDYYCSGIRGGMSYDPDDDNDYFEKNKYVSEGTVTDEICKDFAALGWHPSEWPDDCKDNK